MLTAVQHESRTCMEPGRHRAQPIVDLVTSLGSVPRLLELHWDDPAGQFRDWDPA